MAQLQEPEADWEHFFMHTIEAERSGGEAKNPWTPIPVVASSSDAAPPKDTISSTEWELSVQMWEPTGDVSNDHIT